jgi:ribonuclease R
LGFKSYTHFTSPIRRYPDLIIHRLLKSVLQRQTGQKTPPPYNRQELEDMAALASERESRAVDAERKFDQLKACRLLQNKIGEEYQGRVTGLTKSGLFVRLERYFVEGFLRKSNLSEDSFEFDEEALCYKGLLTRRTVSLGHPVKIRVQKVNIERREIDFDLINFID